MCIFGRFWTLNKEIAVNISFVGKSVTAQGILEAHFDEKQEKK